LFRGVDEEEERAPFLYRPEAGDGRGTRGVAITALVDVGGGRSVAEASPLTWRKLPKRRSGASLAPEKTLRRMVAARRARRNVRQTRAGAALCTSAQRPQRHIRGAYLGEVCRCERPDHFVSPRWRWDQTHFLTQWTQTVAQRRPYASSR
jgi:hypothetical protein